MASEKPEQVRMWSFHQAPLEFQTQFPNGGDTDWVAHIPESQREAIESSLLRWRPIYPVHSTELTDRSVVYHGAPREAAELIADRGTGLPDPLPPYRERRRGIRVEVAYPSQYVTHSQIGAGHTIDISRTGVAFTTETLLTKNSEVTLRVSWPVQLEGGVPVEFRAVGRLARTEPMNAAMQMDSTSFSIDN